MQEFEGYFLSQDPNGFGKLLGLRSSWTAEISKVMARHKVKIITLSEHAGWPDSDITFLTSMPYLEGIHLLSDKVIDLRPIEQLTKLKSVSLTCRAKLAVDLSSLKRLKNVFFTWRDAYRSVFDLDQLVSINILSYPDKDLTSWRDNDRLRELKLGSSRLESLAGLERFGQITTLDLFRCRKLTTIAEVRHTRGIRTLKLDGCKNIQDLSPVADLPELRNLIVEDGGDIESLAPAAQCEKLEFLQICGKTTVLDGDLHGLTTLPNLKRVLIAKRKHYSHTDTELLRKN